MKQVLSITSAVRVYQVIRPGRGFPVAETAHMIREACFFDR